MLTFLQNFFFACSYISYFLPYTIVNIIPTDRQDLIPYSFFRACSDIATFSGCRAHFAFPWWNSYKWSTTFFHLQRGSRWWDCAPCFHSLLSQILWRSSIWLEKLAFSVGSRSSLHNPGQKGVLPCQVWSSWSVFIRVQALHGARKDLDPF